MHDLYEASVNLIDLLDHVMVRIVVHVMACYMELDFVYTWFFAYYRF